MEEEDGLHNIQNTNNTPNQRLPSLKIAWDLVYPGQNNDFREILRNLIGGLEDWELDKTEKSREIKTPDWW